MRPEREPRALPFARRAEDVVVLDLKEPLVAEVGVETRWEEQALRQVVGEVDDA